MLCTRISDREQQTVQLSVLTHRNIASILASQVSCAANILCFASQRRLFCAYDVRTELYNDWSEGTKYFRYIFLKTQEICIKMTLHPENSFL